MTAANTVLNQLRDIHLPQEVSIWPIAPGWYCLGLIILLLVLASFYFWRQFQQKRRLKQAIIKEILAIKIAYEKKQYSAHAAAQALSIVMRRLLLEAHPREEVASIQGQRWLQFFDEQAFAKKVMELAYCPEESATFDAEFDALIEWVKKRFRGFL